MTLATKDDLLKLLAPHRQEHLLAFWDDLAPAQREALARQLRAIDFPRLLAAWRASRAKEDWAALARRASGPPAIRLNRGEHPVAQAFQPNSATVGQAFQPDGSNVGQAFQPDSRSVGQAFQPDSLPVRLESLTYINRAEAHRAGEEALRSGRMGVVLVAGGQGTRLGFDHPKGLYSVGPVSGDSLFKILLEKVLATSRRYGVPLPLYLMTSDATHEETVAYLGEHERFGLPAADVTIFRQGTMPAVDAETGRLLLAAPDRLALSPDGHGGMPAALRRSGALDDIRRRKLDHLFYMQVDNPLVVVCDAEFVGYHLLAGSELSTQVVAKTAPRDRVGNVVSVDGQVRIIEYSDLPDDAAEQRLPDGSLKLWAGSTAMHVFAVDVLDRASRKGSELPFHLARKKVPYLDDRGQLIEPSEANAIKFEQFIFDLLPTARNPIVMEVEEASHFAPVKNAPGSERDSPEKVQAQMIALHRRWLEQAGARIAPGIAVEINPLYALDSAEVAEKACSLQDVQTECCFR